MTEQEIDEALRRHADAVLALPGVTGTARGLCAGQPCVKVYVKKKSAELERRIAGILGGIPLEVEETGEIRALPD